MNFLKSKKSVDPQHEQSVAQNIQQPQQQPEVEKPKKDKKDKKDKDKKDKKKHKEREEESPRPAEVVKEVDFDKEYLDLQEIDLKTIQDVPKVLRINFEQVLKEVQQNFIKSLEKVEKDVAKQLIKVEILKDQISQNHENLTRWNQLKKKKYDQQRDDLLKEKIAWEKDQEKIQRASKKGTEVINLNVGGTVELMTTVDVLRSDKGSNLDKMFSGKHEHKIIDGKVFLDRDGETFKMVINYLRNGQELLPEFETKNQEVMFFKELQFWEIGEKYRNKTPEQKGKLSLDNRKYEKYGNDYVSPYSQRNENIYSMNPNLSSLQVQSDNRMSYNKRGSVQKSDIYSTPSLVTPKGTTKYGERSSTTRGERFGSPRKQSIREKQNDLKFLMSEEPKRRSSTGYSISDDLRNKWKKLGPLTVELIEKHLEDWADVNGQGAEIEFENLVLGQSKAQPQITGQIDKNGVCQGVGKKTSPYSIYEGQFQNDKRHGYGRVIYNSFYYLGEWQFDRQHGYGKQVDLQGNVQEGLWERNNFLGTIGDDPDQTENEIV